MYELFHDCFVLLLVSFWCLFLSSLVFNFVIIRERSYFSTSFVLLSGVIGEFHLILHEFCVLSKLFGTFQNFSFRPCLILAVLHIESAALFTFVVLDFLPGL